MTRAEFGARVNALVAFGLTRQVAVDGASVDLAVRSVRAPLLVDTVVNIDALKKLLADFPALATSEPGSAPFLQARLDVLRRVIGEIHATCAYAIATEVLDTGELSDDFAQRLRAWAAKRGGAEGDA